MTACTRPAANSAPEQLRFPPAVADMVDSCILSEVSENSMQ